MFLDALCQKLHVALYRHEVALQYLNSRHVTDDEIKDFMIGYSRIVAPSDDGSEDFKNFMADTGRGRRFENKVIFPILDMLGRPIGLFGRSIESKEFKFYLTNEGKNLGAILGLHQALPYIYEAGVVFVIEGPFDLLAFRKVYKNSVSALTAGLSDAQYEILSFYAKQVVTVFDSDRPGEEATQRTKEKWPDILSVNLGFKDPDGCQKYFFGHSQHQFEKYVKEKVKKASFFL